MDNEKQLADLKKLREPFPENMVSDLPKPTKQQTDEVKNDYTKGVRCQICGGWHHSKVVHLKYVGHAALTARLLDVDPLWDWKPPTKEELECLPPAGKDGMWIKLTVSGMTRFGFGDSQGKDGGDAIKERIGDALRNAGMRFGMALELWHKGELYMEEPEQPGKQEKPPAKQEAKKQEKPPVQGTSRMNGVDFDNALIAIGDCKTFDSLKDTYKHAYRAGDDEQKAIIQTAYEAAKQKGGWK